jgi:hypothetical protein
MTNAKAIINLQSGTIELEGPVEFVREYLDRYSPSIKGQPTHKAKVARVTVARVKVAKEKIINDKPGKERKINKPLKIIARGTRGRNSCAKIINSEIEAGFFNSPISMKAVGDRLREIGVVCSTTMIRGTLKRTIEEGKLDVMGKGRGTVYMSKAGAGLQPE